jgi:hydrogenase maturation protein HypF
MKTKNNHTILALGADIKSRFCILKDDNLILSKEFGNLDNLENFHRFRIAVLKEKIHPDLIAFDMHPNYYSSRFANSLESERKLAIQHHHAHIASVLAISKIRKPVIGVALDGTGYGSDGNIWGGEFMVADRRSFKRVGHFRYLKMPGAELSVKQPWRMALSLIYDCLGDKIFQKNLEFLKSQPRKNLELLIKMMKQNINSPLTSSAGRIFDAISSILGICHTINFEAEAAIKLEQLAARSKDESCYEFDILKEDDVWIFGYNKLIKGIISDIKKGTQKQDIAKRFHNSLANLIIEVVKEISQSSNLKDVVLSGGVFQNKLLFNSVRQKLTEVGFNLIYNKDVPFSDLSICIGQSYIAQHSK